VNLDFGALKARNQRRQPKDVQLFLSRIIARLQRLGVSFYSPPGPLAQAITFRAFGADNQFANGWLQGCPAQLG